MKSPTGRGAGTSLGCIEALMCLGDKPEVAFKEYRETLKSLGVRTTIEYVYRACELALAEGLLPHTNAGVMSSGRDGNAAAGQRQHGPDARGHLHPPAPARRRPSMGARQGAGAADADAGGSRAAQDSFHHRYPAGNRRDGRGAGAQPDRDSRRPSALRPYPGSDHPELPRQAGYRDGRRAGTRRSRDGAGDRHRAPGAGRGR